MAEKPRFNPDVSLGPVHDDISTWDELATVPFSGDSLRPPELGTDSGDSLVPITIKKSAPSPEKSPSSPDNSIPVRVRSHSRPYSELSTAEQRHSDARAGIATGLAAGALVGAGFVGAGASAPISGAVIGGALAARHFLKKPKKP